MWRITDINYYVKRVKIGVFGTIEELFFTPKFWHCTRNICLFLPGGNAIGPNRK